MVTHPSTNAAVHAREWNSQHVDHKFDTLTTTLTSQQTNCNFIRATWQ